MRTAHALRGAAVLLLTGLGAGCSVHSGGFERDVVVRFTLPAGVFTPPAASVAAIVKNCTGLPDAKLEPIPPATALPSVRLNGVRFDVRGADDAMIANLQSCLNHQPGVTTADLEDEDS